MTAGPARELTPEMRLEQLRDHLRGLGSALVAFSGGVDSTFLSAAAVQALGSRVLAVTVDMVAMPAREVQSAAALAASLGLRHRILSMDAMAIGGFRENSPRRCYHCKLALFGALVALAAAEGLACVIEGTNADDRHDFRPGRDALRELGIRSPLLELGWDKAEIRAASERLALPTAQQPSAACLASRIPYGEPITVAKLEQVQAVEQWLHDQGVYGCRARHHGDVLRVELAENDLPRLASASFRKGLQARALRAGFRFAAVDLEPYRSGRLNPNLIDS